MSLLFYNYQVQYEKLIKIHNNNLLTYKNYNFSKLLCSIEKNKNSQLGFFFWLLCSMNIIVITNLTRY